MVPETNTAVRYAAVLVLFAVILAVSLATGCHSPSHPNDLSSVLVTLKRTACYWDVPSLLGDCPWEWAGGVLRRIQGRHTRGSNCSDSIRKCEKSAEGFR